MIIIKLKQINRKKLKKLIMYFVFGISTTLVNILIYHGLILFQMDYKIANLFAVILGKLYAYVTNKKFVFCSRCSSSKELIKEFLRFAYARGITGLIDYLGLIIAVEYFHTDIIITKYAIQFIIIILNYFFSQQIVFKK